MKKHTISLGIAALCFASISAQNPPPDQQIKPIPTIKQGTKNLENDRIAHKNLVFDTDSYGLTWHDITPKFFDFHTSSLEGQLEGQDVIDRMVTLTPTPRFGNFFYPNNDFYTKNSTGSMPGDVDETTKDEKGNPVMPGSHIGFVRINFVDKGKSGSKNADKYIGDSYYDKNGDYHDLSGVDNDRNLSDGLMILAGGSIHSDGVDPETGKLNHNPDQRWKVKSGMSFFDFGDEVGRVLVLNSVNGYNVNNTQLSKGYYPDNLVAKLNEARVDYDLATDKVANPINEKDYTLLYVPVDWQKYSELLHQFYDFDSSGNVTSPAEGSGKKQATEPIYIRVRVEFNTYANSWTDSNMLAMGDITGIVDNYGTVVRSDGSDKNKSVLMGPDGKNDKKSFYYWDEPDQTYYWTATNWNTYEFNMVLDPKYENSTLIDGVPVIRIQLPANNLINVGTFFIRNIQFFLTDSAIDEESSAYIKDVQNTVNTYLLRPSSIIVDPQKIYVDEPTTLTAKVLPTWATRQVRWVLVDNENRQYSTLDEIYDSERNSLAPEITDYIGAFNPSTGDITAIKSGIVRVQAISIAEGPGEDGVEVEKVMSAITELPLFDVVWGIDILHEHINDIFAGEDFAEWSHRHVELSGLETAALVYQFKAKDGVVVPKFDPETLIEVSSSGSNYLSIGDNISDVHANNRNDSGLLYRGDGSFTVTANDDAVNNVSTDGAKITVKVKDGREQWDMYKSNPTFINGRPGELLVYHYGAPDGFRLSGSKDNTGAYRLYDNDTRLCISTNNTFAFSTDITSSVDTNKDKLHALQAYDWKLVDATASDGSTAKNDLIAVSQDADGKLVITSNTAKGVAHIHITPKYAGAYKASIAAQHTAPQSFTKTLDIDASGLYDIIDSDPAVAQYIPYGPTWESVFSTVTVDNNLYGEEQPFDLPVEINSNGLSGIDDIECENIDNSVLFNLQGIRVDSPSSGVYLKRSDDGTTTKVIIN